MTITTGNIQNEAELKPSPTHIGALNVGFNHRFGVIRTNVWRPPFQKDVSKVGTSLTWVDGFIFTQQVLDQNYFWTKKSKAKKIFGKTNLNI